MVQLLVLVAHNGKTLQLGSVLGSTPIAAVQEVLEELTGIGVANQIAMCAGARLDPVRTLSSYGLPSTFAEEQPVFLYDKAYLRPGANPPRREDFDKITPRVSCEVAVAEHHPLCSAHLEGLRKLPGHELSFQSHQMTAQEHWAVGQKYFQMCKRLLSEQEVQARAIDAARANIQLHFHSIGTGFAEFLSNYSVQKRKHVEVLEEHGPLMDLMRATHLHPDLQRDGRVKLMDLVPEEKLRKWAESCRKAHTHFSEKVANLEGLFGSLKRDVEALFMQAPSVDLDDLGKVLGEKEDLLEEHGSIIQVLGKDLATVKSLVEECVKCLGSNVSESEATLDACAALESMNDSHVKQFLPRLKECTYKLEEFCCQCLDSKNRMTLDVVNQLQQISGQQNRIRDMKNKLVAFREVYKRQDEAFAELVLVGRIPQVYKAALSECVRRQAWMEMYSGQAVRLLEHMDKVRAREMAKRDALQRETTCILPAELLAHMGLSSYPPKCEISIPEKEEHLLQVNLADVDQVAPCQPASTQITLEESASEPSVAKSCLDDLDGTKGASSSYLEQKGGTASPENANEEQDLRLENAKLRANLAGLIAFQHLHHNIETDCFNLDRDGTDYLDKNDEGSIRNVDSEKEPAEVSSEQTINRLKEALQNHERLNKIIEARLQKVTCLSTAQENQIQDLKGKLAVLKSGRND